MFSWTQPSKATLSTAGSSSVALITLSSYDIGVAEFWVKLDLDATAPGVVEIGWEGANDTVMLGFDGAGKRVRVNTGGTVHVFDPFTAFDASDGHSYRLERVNNSLKLLVNGIERWCCGNLNNKFGPSPFVARLGTDAEGQAINRIELDFVRIEKQQ